MTVDAAYTQIEKAVGAGRPANGYLIVGGVRGMAAELAQRACPRVRQVDALAARDDGGQQLLGLFGQEQEERLRRRFLQGLQERIERLGRKHVHLIYDEHRVLSRLRRNLHQFHQILDILHPIIGSGIKLMDAIRAAFSK